MLELLFQEDAVIKFRNLFMSLLTLCLCSLPVMSFAQGSDDDTKPEAKSESETKSGSDEKPESETAKQAAEQGDPVPPVKNWHHGGMLTPPAPTAGSDTNVSLVPNPMISLGQFELNLHGRVQVLFGMVGEDANVSNGDVLSRDGFRIRRARLGLDGRLSEHWLYSMELDLVDEDNGGNALIDASIQYKPSQWAWVKAGAFKPPFSRTLLNSSGSMQFMERPIWVNLEHATGAHVLDLDREVGLSAGGQASLFFYEVGVFNGSPGFSRGDLNNGLMYVLRFGLGMGELGKEEADLSRSDELRWRFALNGYLNQDAAAEYRGAGADLSLKWYGVSFYAEALWAKGIPNSASEDVVTLLDEMEKWGMYAQAGYVLPIDMMTLELVARFAMMDDQVHVDDEGDLWEMTAGINAYFLDDLLKLMIHYSMREEIHGADMSNDMLGAMLQVKF